MRAILEGGEISGTEPLSGEAEPPATGVNFSRDQLDEMFPFFLLLDRGLGIVDAGRSLRKLLPEFEAGAGLERCFKIVRPRLEMGFEAFARSTGSVVVIELSSIKLLLRGQFQRMSDSDRLLFLGSPWMRSLEEFRSVGLRINDFAIHDPMIDLLHLLQTQKAAMEDVRKLIETEKIQSAELAEARDRALDSSRAKSAFLATMSHEIRTPLNALLGSIEVLFDSPLDDRQRRIISTLRTAGEELVALINDILDFSRIESGLLVLNLRPLDVVGLAEECLELHTPRARQKGLAMHCDSDPRAPRFVVGDDLRFRQILGNLLGNAVKFTDTGEIRLAVRVEELEGEKARVRFEVADTGIGIADHLHDKVFDRFFQVESGMNQKYGGTGLGLAIVRSISQAMNGEASCRSRPGGGSVFSVSFECDRVRVVPEKFASSPSVVKLPPGGPWKVLIVDDSHSNREIVRAFLEDQDVVVAEASDGLQGVELYGAADWDLVLMDLRMPIHDGYQTMRSIFENDAKAGKATPPVLAISADVLPETVSRIRSAGFSGMVEKPFSKEKLIGKMSETLTACREAIGNVAVSADSRGEDPKGRLKMPHPETSGIRERSHDGDGGELLPPEAHRMIEVEPEVEQLRPRFFRRLNENLAALRASIERRDFENLKIFGHTLKGNGGAYGFPFLSALGANLQAAAERRDLESAIRLVEQTELAVALSRRLAGISEGTIAA